MAGQNWQKLFVKADKVIYRYIVTVSGQCFSVAIILSDKIDFYAYVVGFQLQLLKFWL